MKCQFLCSSHLSEPSVSGAKCRYIFSYCASHFYILILHYHPFYQRQLRYECRSAERFRLSNIRHVLLLSPFFVNIIFCCRSDDSCVQCSATGLRICILLVGPAGGGCLIAHCPSSYIHLPSTHFQRNEKLSYEK